NATFEISSGSASASIGPMTRGSYSATPAAIANTAARAKIAGCAYNAPIASATATSKPPVGQATSGIVGSRRARTSVYVTFTLAILAAYERGYSGASARDGGSIDECDL